MKVTYIDHSGFAVETERHMLIFDYYRGELPRPADADKKTVFFVSHIHEDHYNPDIFDAGRGGAYYVLSSEIDAPDGVNAKSMGPHETAEIAGVAVRTLRSTDCGVAYLLNVDGKTIYHAGDLHLWIWDGAPSCANAQMRRQFESELSLLSGVVIDAAFLPLDPRQGENGTLGFDYAMRTLDIKKAFPMHFWGRGEYAAKFAASDTAAPYRDRIAPLTKCGESIEI